MITGSISLVTAIAGAVIYFETTYAHANDVKEVLKQQEQQIKMYERSQRQQQLFQLEYYDDRIKALQQERDATVNKKRAEDIQTDINDLKQRRSLLRNTIENR